MSTLKNKLVIGGITAAILTGGAASAWAETTAPTPIAASSSTTDSGPSQAVGQHHARQGQGHGHSHRHGLDTKALAQKLGITEEKLTQALDSIRQEHKDAKAQGRDQQGKDESEQQETPAERQKEAEQERADFTKELAKKLGIDQAKVTTALDQLRTEQQAQAKTTFRTELSSRLDKAVSAGKLTSADRDSVLKAFDAGVLAPQPGDQAPDAPAQ